MKSRRLAALAALGLPLALSGGLATQAWAHGSPASPPSRDYYCAVLDKGGVEEPQSAGCKASKARSGTEPIYNYEESIIRNSARRGLDGAPDGQLCNAGQSERAGLNLAPKVANYVAMPVSAGTLPIEYRASTPHPTQDFLVYLSKPEYDGSAPLKKDDLILLKKAQAGDFMLVGDTFRLNVDLPQRASGSKAVMLIDWEVKPLESDEGYYTCSDIVYK